MRARRQLVVLAIVAGWSWLAMASPAAADNCDLRINPQDCQNTAWTVGTVAAVAAAATAAAVAAGSAAAGAAATPSETGETEGGDETAEPVEPPGPITDIVEGERAMEILQEMGLVRGERQPDGTIRYVPETSFENLESGGATTYQELGTAVDPATGRLTHVQEATVTRVGGVAWTPGPDGSIQRPIIIIERQPATPWQHVNELAPGVRAQGTSEFVDAATQAFNAGASTNAGQQILNEIGATGQQVRIRQETDPNAGNSYGASRWRDRFQNRDGTSGIGTGGNVHFDPNRLQAGDGSEPWHRRPPAVGLWHELAHARDAAQGNQALGQAPDPRMPAGTANPNAWNINNREMQATSIGPWSAHASDENALRSELNLPRRDSYAL